MEVLYKFAQPWIAHVRFFSCLLDSPKTCSFVGLIKLCRILTGLFWHAVVSFAGLFDGLYYIFTGESTSKADEFDNLRSMKILNTPLTQTRPEIHTKRPVQEQTPQKKKGAIRRAWRWRSTPFDSKLRFFSRQKSNFLPRVRGMSDDPGRDVWMANMQVQWWVGGALGYRFSNKAFQSLALSSSQLLTKIRQKSLQTPSPTCQGFSKKNWRLTLAKNFIGRLLVPFPFP